ncbi:NADPH-dependent FMN reductase [Streptomyces griseorubiginosus]|uniref:NADPH-dependent FMN reductase n=1 Tax=Streptomyces griseorubiginosus TaxID=67304 RepID=UPI001AD7B69B|nr:NAD(P)H-dependent oxidoreductase [Streptomyces griseorubiginosus]MBO4252347.1 NADPH-dependent FMN reductase [Streptomyces griseorubiginosus]
MSDRLVLQVILCSVRSGRVGEPLTRWFSDTARAHGHFDVEDIDLKETALPLHDEPDFPVTRKYTQPHTVAWSKTIERGDAYVFVTPEYNHGYSPSAKNAIDYLCHEWAFKPVSFVSYGGISAGTRSVQQLMQVLQAVRAVPIAELVAVPFSHTKLDEDGNLAPDEPLSLAAIAVLDELARMANGLKPLRRPLPPLS